MKALPSQTIGIVGCGGFIGSHLVEALLDTGRYRVYGIDLASEKIDHLRANPDLIYVRADAYGESVCAELLENCDTVVLLAALCNPSLYNTVALQVIESNFTKPFHFVSRCAGLGKRVIYFSTCEVYGKTIGGLCRENGEPGRDDEAGRSPLLREDSSPCIYGPIQNQRWSYAASKQLMERAVYALGVEKGLTYTIVRPFNFIGPRMDFIPGIDGEGIPRVVACFMKELLCNEPLRLVDGGVNRRCFTDIRDACDAVCRIIDNPGVCHQRIFNIGNPGNEVAIHELAEIMIRRFSALYPERKSVRETVTVSGKQFYGEGYDDCDRRVPDITRATESLGWHPTISLERAIDDLIVYFVEQYRHRIVM